MKPGIYKKMSFAEYLAIPAINNSTLNNLYGVVPEKGRISMAKSKDSPSKSLGRYLHSMVLESDLLAKEYFVTDGRPKRSKEDKAYYADISERGLFAISPDQHKSARLMRESILGNDCWPDGESEITFIWNDEETGLLCKCRVDRLDNDANIWDIKSSRDAYPYEFSRSIYNYGYHRQSAFYRKGVSALLGNDPDFNFMVVENEEPHLSVWYQLDDTSISVGKMEVENLLKQYQGLKSMPVWPGYPTGKNIISLPEWVLNQYYGGL